MDTNTRTTSTDETLRLLAHERRRKALQHLSQAEEATTVDSLAERVAAETDPDHDDGVVKSVETDLHHVHLPKMDEVGVVDYDARSGTVRYRPRPTVEELLDAVAERTE